MFNYFRYALRQLRKSLGFTLTAVLTLAIGIGGVAAAFSIVYAVLMRPLPYAEPSQLVRIHEGIRHFFERGELSPPDVLTFQHDSRAFSSVAGFTNASYELTGDNIQQPIRAKAERVSATFFPLLGVHPLLGRNFTPSEDSNSAAVVVLSYSLWQNQLHSDPGVLGHTIQLDRRPYTIIGVMPPDFEAPLQGHTFTPRDLWVPLSLTPQEKQMEGDSFDFSCLARLKPGITMAQAQSDVDRVIAGIQKLYPASSGVQLVGSVAGLKAETVDQVRPLLRVLFGVALLILLIAAANLANLLLVRAAGHRREAGIRLALGASRKSMLMRSVAEGLILSIAGGGLGLLLAALALHAAPVLLPDTLPRLHEIRIYWPVVGWGAALALITGVGCGLAPAVMALQMDVIDALREGSVSSGTGKAQKRLRVGLVVAEASIAMLLLVGSGMLLHSLIRMMNTDPGFQPQHLLTAEVALPLKTYSTQQSVVDFLKEVQQRTAQLPGVKSVGFGSNLPVVGANSNRLFTPQGHVRQKNESWLLAANYLVEGSYFESLRIPLLRGRYFEPGDDEPGAPLVMIISQSLADRYWPARDPVGQLVKVGDERSPMPWIKVIGVVGDVKQDALDKKVDLQAYQPLSQLGRDLGPIAEQVGVEGDIHVLVRTSRDPSALAYSLQQVIHQLDSLLAVTHVQTMDTVIASTEAPRRFTTFTVTSFSVIALLLALMGIYGVVAFAVTESIREIAIRMALGSTREGILVRTVRSALLLAGAGMVLGLAAALLLTRYLSSLLYDVQALDAASIFGAVVVILGCAALAGWVPARRAASVDPMQVLRSE